MAMLYAQQIARVLRHPWPEIGRRSRDEALGLRPERNGDHILGKTFIIPNAGVETGSQHVDETSCDDFAECRYCFMNLPTIEGMMTRATTPVH